MVKVVRSTVVDVPIDEVWALLRDFNGHDRWHPAVAVSRIEERRGSDEIGCVRDFALKQGGAIREQLLSLSDRDYSFTYCILDAPLPLDGYVATVRLKPVTDGNRTFWHWQSEFKPPPEREAELARMVGEDIYEGGFAAIKAILARQKAEVGAIGRPRPAIASAPAKAIDCGAVVLARYGGPEALEWRSVGVPPPGPGEVRLRHTAVGVNFIDVYCRTGYFNLVPPGGVPGLEAAGIVTDVGPGVRELAPGDRVGYAGPPPGAYAELRTMPARLLVRLPPELDEVTAAAVLLKGMTAEFLLHRVARVKEGDTVLVHAAAGGTGQLLTQWARALGATVIGTVGSRDKVGIARVAGCEHPIVYTEEDFAARCREITAGRGVDVAFDAVGRDTLLQSYAALATNGHLVSFGQASGETAPIDIAGFADKSATVSRPNFAHFTDTPEKVRSITDNLFRALRMGTLRPAAPTRFTLSRAADAHRALEGRHSTGAIVLLP
jgi:NADPH:quinone reductase-like Zn-dependent oxidoreductase